MGRGSGDTETVVAATRPRMSRTTSRLDSTILSDINWLHDNDRREGRLVQRLAEEFKTAGFSRLVPDSELAATPGRVTAITDLATVLHNAPAELLGLMSSPATLEGLNEWHEAVTPVYRAVHDARLNGVTFTEVRDVLSKRFGDLTAEEVQDFYHADPDNPFYHIAPSPGQDPHIPLPFTAVWDQRASAANALDAMRQVMSPAAFESAAKSVEADLQPVAMRLFTTDRPWADAQFVTSLRRSFINMHGGSRMKVGGLTFEGTLATSLEEAGYRVFMMDVGNPGADLQAALQSDQVLEGISLKSATGKSEKNGKMVHLGSLAPHGLKKAPATVDDMRAACDKALEHLARYEKILYLQAMNDVFPVYLNDEKELSDAWRYNITSLPHDYIERAFERLDAEDFRQARKAGGTVTIDVLQPPLFAEQTQSSTPAVAFQVKMNKSHVGIAAVQPALSTTAISMWTTPPEGVASLPRQA
jgi:hypothetical protein